MHNRFQPGWHKTINVHYLPQILQDILTGSSGPIPQFRQMGDVSFSFFIFSPNNDN